MTKVLVVYESKYGNTRLVAEKIIEGMKEDRKLETALNEVGEVDLQQLSDYDVILIGSPNHIGGPTRGVKGFIDKLGKLELSGKQFAVFDTYIGKDFEKAVKKTENRISEKAPTLKKIVPGLSIRVKGMKGPVLQEEFPKCKEFGKKIAAQIKE